nr:unnamed protein product [Digitaria exilis]
MSFQSRSVACRPRSLLENNGWMENTEERKRRETREDRRRISSAAQVPGGRFGGQDQKGSLTRRSFLCSDSALPSPVTSRRAPRR